ncbi:hypothetical protein L9F63_026839 [Diploptera punctata]|uniref:CHK kinase-like domain-containing protein n=1 Tax=Diploptera punctata TaxID=6984 RepID=A0AAD8AFE3_DIPPU|nr:hypothetical protein L9F63_026839 [Diploptera punctata]
MDIEENGDSTFPSWISFEFLTKVLSEELKKDVSVTNFEIERAVPKGENYLSILYRVMVEYKDSATRNHAEKYFIIIKTLPESELMKKILTEMDGFQKELYMYTNILPEMHRIIKSAKEKIQQISARCLPCPIENVIVLEDLKHLGFQMAMRKEGLDLEHCKLAVRNLARFHAASMALYKIDPSFADKYKEGLFKECEDEKEKKKSQKDMEDMLYNLAATVEKWEGYEKYAQKLKESTPTMFERMTEIVKPKNNYINVLNHGDCWTNNMLFYYCPKTGKVEDIRFVDFQISRYSSPALDLQYLLCNCPNDEVRFQHKDTLLEEYYFELADYCKAMHLESDLISFEQLKDEFEEKNYLD